MFTKILTMVSYTLEYHHFSEQFIILIYGTFLRTNTFLAFCHPRDFVRFFSFLKIHIMLSILVKNCIYGLKMKQAF